MLKILFNQYFWLGVILFLAFLVRLYKIDAPIADWHSWRQADTAAVTRNFVREGFNPFVPKFDDMSGIAENPLINTNRFRFVEFPVYNIAVYLFYVLFGINEVYHRLVSIFFSLGSIIFVFLITKKYLGIVTSLLSTLVFALLPFNVFFSRTILPEPTFIFFSLGMVYFVDRWIWERRVIWGIWGFMFMIIAFLIKPWAIFFMPPLIYSAFKKGKSFLRYLLFFTVAITPFVVWRLWILQHPEGIPASSWLLNGDGIRFRPAFFWWIISERLGREILGATGLVLAFIGIIAKLESRSLFFHIWLLSMGAYLIILATGNVTHNYYQLMIIPILSIFLARGFVYLFKGNKDFISRIWTVPLAILLLLLSFYFTYKIDKEFYKINNPQIVEAGKMVDRILPKDALVLAPYNGDTAFLYQLNRPGFPNAPLPIKQMVSDYSVTHYVSVNFDEKTNWVKRHFEIIFENEKFVIADLTKIKSPLDDILDAEP